MKKKTDSFVLPVPPAPVAPVFNLAATVATVDSIKFTWAPGSSLTASYLIYVKRVTNTRDYSASNFTLLANTTSTSFTASSLASGTFYTFLVSAVTATGEVNNQVQFTFQTQAAAGQGQLPEGCTCLGDKGEKRREGTPAHVLICLVCVPCSGACLGRSFGRHRGGRRRDSRRSDRRLCPVPPQHPQEAEDPPGRVQPAAADGRGARTKTGKGHRTQGKGTGRTGKGHREHRERAHGTKGTGIGNTGKGPREHRERA